MRLVLKLTAALMLAVCAVFAGYGYVSIRHQVALFETDILRDQRVLSRALSVAVGEIWRADGAERALAVIRAADAREAKTHIRWLALPISEEIGLDRTQAAALTDALATGRAQVRIDRDGKSARSMFTYRSVIVDGRTVGAIELSESLAEERRHIREHLWRVAGTGVLMAAISGVVATLFGAHLVGRPIQTLIDKARRTGAGDFTTPLALTHRDEIGELGQEMNAMAARLAETSARLSAETAARLGALDQLRHAERLTTVGTLASGIAHELGTPLNVVAGRAKMMAAGDTPPPELARNAEIIVDQVRRMAEIIRQLLDFARRRPPERRGVDLCALARQTVVLLDPLAKKHQVTIAVDGAAAPVDVDGAQIQQVLANVIMNAVQASPAGASVQVRIERRRAAPPTGIGGTACACVVATVEDHGAGISAEARAHIFEPFFTTKEVGEGTGLGLSVSYGIVREHGGWIDVQSTPGDGTRFDICLPESAA